MAFELLQVLSLMDRANKSQISPLQNYEVIRKRDFSMQYIFLRYYTSPNKCTGL